jgi:nitrate reductase gamma subunit
LNRISLRAPQPAAFLILGVAILIAIMAVPTACLGDAKRNGSWFLDSFKYHVSAHGRTSCTECHPDAMKRAVHPDPALVNKKARQSSSSDICFNCHDGEAIKASLEKGLHGGKPITCGADYARCIDCHDPHYQPRPAKKSAAGSDTVAQAGDRCAVCHEKRETLPPPEGEDVKCMGCHKSPDEAGRGRKQAIEAFCLHCHGKEPLTGRTSAAPVSIDPPRHASKGHDRLDCMACHPASARFEHDKQRSADCRICHAPHREAAIHDAHSRVSCEACHLTGMKAGLDGPTGKIVSQRPQRSAFTSSVGIRNPGGDEACCKECHHKGNALGAVAVILPAKSVICMPCHTATFSVGDPITVVSLLGFALGLFAVVSVWMSGVSGQCSKSSCSQERSLRVDFSSRVMRIFKALILDVLFQQRLLRQSPQRWIVHCMIFWPFLLRCGWGLAALVGSLLWPDQAWVSSMLDKNAPLTAFLFDFTGLMLVFGVALAVAMRRTGDRAQPAPGLPERDQWAVGLLAAIVVVGFLLEGARISLTGVGSQAGFAFVGRSLTFLWNGTNALDEIYGYLWYAHAVLTGAFVVYLPFSGLFHMIVAPVVAVLNATDARDKASVP